MMGTFRGVNSGTVSTSVFVRVERSDVILTEFTGTDHP